MVSGGGDNGAVFEGRNPALLMTETEYWHILKYVFSESESFRISSFNDAVSIPKCVSVSKDG